MSNGVEGYHPYSRYVRVALRLPIDYTSLPQDRKILNVKISFNSTKGSYDELDGKHGFGNAAISIIDTLRYLGHKVEFNDPTAEVGIVFNHPSRGQFYPHQYNILYFPWESTELHEGWGRVMDGVDEVWTPSQWCADVFARHTTTPVYVYEHGIDHSWKPRLRKRNGPIKFLNHGAEAARKNMGWQIENMLKMAIPSLDFHYTLKFTRIWSMPDPTTFPLFYASKERFTKIYEDMSLVKLQELYYANDVYVYPSAGEGFGLTPLQAMASGMPTITVKDWAPYADLLDPDLTLSGKLVPTQWEEIHPGKVYRIDQSELIKKLQHAYNNFDEVAHKAYLTAPLVHERYDWNTLTRDMFSELEKRLNS